MKHIKLWLYGAPGTGKSVFAYRLGKELQKIDKENKKGVFFLTTDGNYEWLEDFGADPKDCAKLASWSELKKVVGSSLLNDYGTIVVDLLEDLYKWGQQEFCAKNNLQYIGDANMGKGWAVVSDDFTAIITKLINMPKHIIFISHEEYCTKKNRYGVESLYYFPTSKLRTKDCDTIEGRMRYVLRAYLENEIDSENDKRLISKRYLSLTPKADEFSIIRGINVDAIPSSIPLDAKSFLEVINFMPSTNTSTITQADKDAHNVEIKPEVKPEVKVEVKPEVKVETVKNTVEVKPEVKVEATIAKESNTAEETKTEEKKELSAAEKIANLKARYAAASLQKTVEAPKKDVVENISEVIEQPSPVSSAKSRIEALKAKLAANTKN